MTDTDASEVEPLFPIASPVVQKVTRKNSGAGKPRWSKYSPINPVKCDDCMLILALAKGDAPASRQARWRRQCGDSDLLLCYGHAALRREEDGMRPLKDLET
jgi:hypothetical protein